MTFTDALPGETRARRLPRRLRRAAGLIDYIFYLILVIVGVLFIIRLYNSGSAGLKNVQLTTEMARIEAAIDNAYSNSVTIDAVNLVPVLNTSGQFTSAEISSDGTSLFTPYHTPVTVAGNGDTTYTVTFTSLPQNACTALLNAFGNDSTGKLQSATVNGTAMTVPPTTQATSAACTLATGNSVALVL
jgi:hypothetical protein